MLGNPSTGIGAALPRLTSQARDVSDAFNQFVTILKQIERDEEAKLELRLAEAWVR